MATSSKQLDRNDLRNKYEQLSIEFNSLYDTVPIGLWRTSIETGEFLRANAFCARILGYGSAQSLMKEAKSTDFYTDESRQELLTILEKDGNVCNFEVPVKLPNGKATWLSLTARLDRENGWLEGSLVDISAHKEIQKRLSELKMNEISDLKNLQIMIRERIGDLPCSDRNSGQSAA